MVAFGAKGGKINAAIYRLREHGYHVELAHGDTIQLTWQGDGEPDALLCTPLFDVVRAQKPEIVAELRAEDAKQKNVFNRANRLPDGVIFATECNEHPQCFIAYRVGARTLVGHGATQCDAVLNLADLEAIQNKTPDYLFPPT